MQQEKINIELTEEERQDVDTMANFIVSLNALKTKYAFKTPAYQKKYSDAGVLIDKINNYLLTK